MLVLAIDSSSSACSACVWQDGKVLAQAQEEMERGQDAHLMPMIVHVLFEAQMSFDQLERIAVTRGPGSFTGVRVGLAAARGIGLASNKPVVGINRFAIYRKMNPSPGRNLLVVIQSKRAELFCQFFPEGGLAYEPCMMNEEEIKIFLDHHPHTDRVGDNATLDQDIIAVCALIASEADLTNPDYAPTPLYLRAPDVTLPSAKSR